jgi:hypothetical protein
VVALDHDQLGEEAGPLISRILQRSMAVVRFGKDFPDRFDLADDFPSDLWEEKRGHLVYVGPTLSDCLAPATWATRMIPPTEKGGRPGFVLRDEFVREWAFSIVPDAFVYLAHLGRRYSASEFDADNAAFSDVEKIAKLRRKRQWGKASTIVYDPGSASGVIASHGGGHVINVYYPSAIKPRKGNVRPFIRFLFKLIPIKRDRRNLMRIIATLVARPDIHMLYGTLLISETQGVGKSTLAEKILAPLIGRHNTSFPSAAEVTDSSFNSWRAFKRLAVIEELYDGQTSRAYNRLKSTTAEIININEKYEKPFAVKNWIHIVASSNSMRALKLAGTDRRWFVPGVTEKIQPDAYWRKFNEWLGDGGLEIIAWWAEEFVKNPDNVVETGEHAPDSTAKDISVIASMSDGEKFIMEFGEDLAAFPSLQPADPLPCVVRLDELRVWLANKKRALNDDKYGDNGYKFLETPETIARVLRKIKGLYFCAENQRFKVGGSRFRIVANFQVGPEATWDQLGRLLRSPHDVVTM